MQEIYGIIYKIRNKINNKLYFGQTTNKRGFRGRYSNKGFGIKRIYNRYILRKNNNLAYNKHLFRSIEKYGFDNFEVDENFDVAYSKKELDSLEDLYIKIYETTKPNRGYNNKTGGSHGKHSEEVKINQSKRMKGKFIGNKSPLYGIHKYGKDSARWGIPCSEDTKAKISKKNKGKLSGKKNPSARSVICITTGVVFDTIKEGAELYNCDVSQIVKCCKRKIKYTGKLPNGIHLVWMYYEEYKKDSEVICNIN
jgi:group I intron endonuclease